ncbi:hypothetical protein AB595_19055 [Massilia sp. WF1]|nr:hypothetical protein AM586_03995 [Massilia sp. WG5]KLU35243.1 hypothetical protein AB595_19055 [Massilia sp. WF1]
MKSVMHTIALAGMLAFATGSAGAAVTVTYVQPDNFTDLPAAPGEREDALKDLTEHFTRLGNSLPPGQDLRIEVLDVDLAGRAIPRAGALREVRVLRNADWPRMELRYSLEQGGQVIKSGEAQLSDMAFLDHRSRYFENVTLRYDKQMIDDWYVKTIGPLPPKARR